MYVVSINSLIVFIIALTVTSVCVPFVLKLAIKKRLLGEYGEGRHVHKGFVPRLGGVAICTGFFFSQLYFISFFFWRINMSYLILLFGYAVVFLGVVDDIVSIRAHLKFCLQLVSVRIGVAS